MAQKLSASRISPEPVTIDDLNSGLQKKQNKLIAGTGIQIEDDTISSTVNSAEWGNITGDITQQTDLIEKLAESGGSGKTDNITITKNEADELQAEGCLNQLNNTTPIKFWSGTKAEYDAIKIKDDDTLYNVDEDSSTIHSGDDEVITGIKTFDGQEKRQSITITNDLVDINTESETPSYSSIYFTDKKTSKVIGDVASATTKYNTGMLMACENPYNLTPSETIKQESLYPQIGVYSYPDGTYSSVAPEPVESSNDQNIATTSFVNKTVDKKVGNEINSNLLNYTTNRILEIPQDIKLEINNGSITLKAGSKVYDGLGNSYIVPNDIVASTPGGSQSKQLICIKKDFSQLFFVGVNPYDTDLTFNQTTGMSDYQGVEIGYLPIGISTKNDTQYTSIEQVFNGFGYIGSTVFVLPGIKCQFADGRNEDGSYKSYTKSTSTVLTKTFGSETFGSFDCSLCCANDTIDDLAWHVNEDFDNKSGYIIINNTEEIVKNLCPIFRFFINSSTDNGVISQFIPNLVDKLNWKHTELSGMSMPSNKYINLTLGASGTTYTAPANGWFTINKHCTPGKFVAFSNTSSGDVTWIAQVSVETDCRASCPARSGDRVTLWYSADGQLYYLRFIYAQGSQ